MKKQKLETLQYVPFLSCNPKYNKRFSSKQGANNFVSTMIGSTIVIGYFVMALNHGFNPWKWKENVREFQREQKLEKTPHQQNFYRKQFHELDKNKDYVIDSTEFIYRNKK